MAHRVYIVEDHDWLRQMLIDFVDAEPDLTVCGAARTGEAALEDLAQTPADVVVVDLSLPRMSGTDVMRAIHDLWPDLPCVVLSAHSDARSLEGVLAAGAHGFVPKNDPQDLIAALRTVLAGGRWGIEAANDSYDAPPGANGNRLEA